MMYRVMNAAKGAYTPQVLYDKEWHTIYFDENERRYRWYSGRGFLGIMDAIEEAEGICRAFAEQQQFKTTYTWVII